MIFFAWSLILSAVNYARKQKIISVLSKHFLSPTAYQNAIKCRRLKWHTNDESKAEPSTTHSNNSTSYRSRNSSHMSSECSEDLNEIGNMSQSCSAQTFETTNSIYKAPSDVTSIKDEEDNDDDNNEQILFFTEYIEIVRQTLPYRLFEFEWQMVDKQITLIDSLKQCIASKVPTTMFIVHLHPVSHNNVELLKRVFGEYANKSKNYKFVETIQNALPPIDLETEVVFNLPPFLLDNFCERIAYKTSNSLDVIYKCDLETFYNVVYYWSESALYSAYNLAIGEYITCLSPSYIEVMSEFKQSEPTLLQPTLFPQISNMCTSLNSSIVSLNSRRNSISSGTDLPLLELLFLLDQQDKPISQYTPSKTSALPKKLYPDYLNTCQMNQQHLYKSDSSLNNHSQHISLTESMNGDEMLPTKANSEICKAIHLQSSALPPSPWGSLRSLKQPSQRPPIPKTAPNTPKHITYRSSQLTSVRQASMPRSNRSASVNESRFSVTPVTFSTNSRAVVVSISRYTVLSPRNQSSNYPQQFRARSFSASSKAEDSAIINNNIIQASLFKNKINNKEIETILSMQASPTKNWKSNMPQPNGLANIEESNDIPMVELRKAEVEPGHFLDIKRRSRHASIQIGEMSGLTSDAVPPSFEELSQRRRSLSPRLIAHRNYNLTELLDRQLPEICAKSLFRVNPNTPRRRFCDLPLPCIEDEDCSGGSSSKKAIKNLPKFEPKRIKPRTNTKPPQIAVYAGDDAILYGKVKETVCSILPRSTYTIYHLTNDEMKSDHWIDKSTCCVLICDTNTLDANCWTKLQLYFTQTGKVIFLCQNSILDNFKNCKSWSGKEKWTKRLLGKKGLSRSINKEFDSFLKKCHKHFRTNDEINDTFTAYDSACGYNYSVVFKKDKGAPLLLFMESSSSNAIALFSDTTTEELIEARNSNVLKDLLRKADIITDGDKPIPKVVNITTGYLICKEDKRLLKLHGLKFNQKMGNNPSIIFFSCIDGKEINLPNHEDDCIMVKAVNRNHKIPKFDLNAYFRRLKTKTLGHAILHTDVSKSVMKVSNTITKELVTCDGIVVIANTQTEGYGRNRSEWLSPRGSALFSFDFNIPINSNLGQKIGFLQHIMAVAIVDAIHTIVTLQDFPVKIKWPNDIYFDRSFKVGGVFSETCIYGDVYKCVIGVGINILNPKPTVCLNDMLPKDYGSQLNIAEVIAEILNKFEFHVVMFEKRGYQAFLKEYIYFWLHTDEEVTIEGKSRLPKDAQQCIIKGIDQHGLLEVKNKKSGETFSVDSDGNSFDMLKGLIKIKYAN